jgi:hypothetical protein
MKLGIGIALLILGAIVAIAGLGGFAVSFAIGGDLGGGSGIKALDFIASNFRLVCAMQIPIGICICLVGGMLVHSERKERCLQNQN